MAGPSTASGRGRCPPIHQRLAASRSISSSSARVAAASKLGPAAQPVLIAAPGMARWPVPCRRRHQSAGSMRSCPVERERPRTHPIRMSRGSCDVTTSSSINLPTTGMTGGSSSASEHSTDTSPGRSICDNRSTPSPMQAASASSRPSALPATLNGVERTRRQEVAGIDLSSNQTQPGRPWRTQQEKAARQLGSPCHALPVPVRQGREQRQASAGVEININQVGH